MLRCAVAVVETLEHFLICQRPLHQSMAGYWEFPGGKIEANETPYQAMVRECAEEVGIVVLKARPLISFTYQYPLKKIELNVYQVLDYQGQPYGIENQLLKWVQATNFEQFTFLPASPKIFKALAART